MPPGSILQYATLLSFLIGTVSVAVAVALHRDQVKTQIFLAMSARYDELMRNSAAGLWINLRPGTILPERGDDLTISALRFCILVSLTYFLFRERHIPKRMWLLMLRSAERRMRSQLFVREWEHLKPEFESFPEFVELVTSVHHGRRK
ncbi:MAG TPA: hypothetical protein VJ323_09215 [Bryobacteraceae bacterium]|jgi:hypothetical protein|nr:hypothetical protein [Bryobacteraceae bacterium]